ncbi:MAG: SseB family protein [Pseudomonadota bacterium]
MTVIDRAHAKMDASEADRLQFYERLADAELFLLLDHAAEGEHITPKLFPVEGDTLVLAFDREERLAEFAGAAPYAALSGRRLAHMLSGAALGLGLNLEVAPSAIILPSTAMAWLDETLGHTPGIVDATPQELHLPKGLPDALLSGLDTKLAMAAGMARNAYLCGVAYEGGARSHLLAFIDPLPGAEDALARAVNEALVFSGVEAGALDVAFFTASDPMAARLAKTGLRFDLPEPAKPAPPDAPGMNPDKPPTL